MDYRKDEPAKTWFRSDRVFRSEGHWFFYTREGITVGPYTSRFEAEVDVGLLVAQLTDGQPDKSKSIVREFLLYADTACADMNDAGFTDYLVDEVVELLNPGAV